jgi:hypothetical protein
LHTHADPPKTILFVAKKVPIAAKAKIKVLTGVKEQNALYPSRHVLLASTLGVTVLNAERLKMTITAMRAILSFRIYITSSKLFFRAATLFPAVDAREAFFSSLGFRFILKVPLLPIISRIIPSVKAAPTNSPIVPSTKTPSSESLVRVIFFKLAFDSSSTEKNRSLSPHFFLHGFYFLTSY